MLGWQKILQSTFELSLMILWTNVLSRWMFWTDWGRAAKIERCGMDGTRRSEVIGDEVMWPNSVAVDYERDRLYWTDAGLHRIETSRLDGSHRKVYSIIIITSAKEDM